MSIPSSFRSPDAGNASTGNLCSLVFGNWSEGLPSKEMNDLPWRRQIFYHGQARFFSLPEQGQESQVSQRFPFFLTPTANYGE